MRVRANGETFRETMFSRQCFLVCGGLYINQFVSWKVNRRWKSDSYFEIRSRWKHVCVKFTFMLCLSYLHDYAGKCMPHYWYSACFCYANRYLRGFNCVGEDFHRMIKHKTATRLQIFKYVILYVTNSVHPVQWTNSEPKKWSDISLKNQTVHFKNHQKLQTIVSKPILVLTFQFKVCCTWSSKSLNKLKIKVYAESG